MGTRGLVGFRLGDKVYFWYNHWDSTLHVLGKAIVNELIKALRQGTLFTEWIEKFKNLKIVDDEIEPTEEDIEALKEFTDVTISECSTKSWYCLTAGLQKSPKKILDSGYLYCAADPSIDKGTGKLLKINSRFTNIEYTYLIDFENKRLEVRTPVKYKIPLEEDALKSCLSDIKKKTKERQQLAEERQCLERERLCLKRERQILEKERHLFEEERLLLEEERYRLEKEKRKRPGKDFSQNKRKARGTTKKDEC